MADSDDDPSTSSSMPQRPPLTSADMSLNPTAGVYDNPQAGTQAWHASDHLASGRSSQASTDNEDIESVRELLRQRRLSRHSSVIDRALPEETNAGIKAIKLAIREHELPIRMAYKQLDELAANAERVKASIEKNRSLLWLQVKRNNCRYTRAAFTGWRLYIDRKVGQKTMVKRAKTLLLQGLLSRTFKAWCLYLLRNRKYKRFLLSVEKILNRHLLQRLWKAWVGFVRQKVKKDDDRRKEKRLRKDLNEKLRERLARRAEVIMHRRRMAKLFFTFLEGCQLANRKRCYMQDLDQTMSKKKMGRVFKAWYHYNKVRAYYKRAVKKFANRRLGTCFRAWRCKDFYADICSRKVWRRRLTLIFAAWVDWLGRKKKINGKIERRRLLWYFNGFRHGCQQSMWRRCFQKKLSKKLLDCKLKMAFRAWLCFMQVQEQKKALKLQDYVTIIEKENERSKLECARLAGVVESGEWGKQQLAEILEAKDVLTGEREALAALIGRLNQQQTAILVQKEKNDNEMRQFKEQLFGNNFIHHNKMLIKGASSFNTVVRALKMDALKRGVCPEFLYALDRLAMDKVSVFPDGEIRVKTLCNFEKGKWMPKSSSSDIPDLRTSYTASSPPNKAQAQPSSQVTAHCI